MRLFPATVLLSCDFSVVHMYTSSLTSFAGLGTTIAIDRSTMTTNIMPLIHNIGSGMMTSPNGSIFRGTGPLWGEFTGHRWISLTKASDAELWYILWSTPEQTVEKTIETPMIWDARSLVMKSPYLHTLTDQIRLAVYNFVTIGLSDILWWIVVCSFVKFVENCLGFDKASPLLLSSLSERHGGMER